MHVPGNVIGNPSKSRLYPAPPTHSKPGSHTSLWYAQGRPLGCSRNHGVITKKAAFWLVRTAPSPTSSLQSMPLSMDLWRKAIVAARTILKLQQIPAADENGCVDVTDENFRHVVLQSSVDVFIVFYTPDVVHSRWELIKRRPRLLYLKRFSRGFMKNSRKRLSSLCAIRSCIVSPSNCIMTRQSSCIPQTRRIFQSNTFGTEQT